MPEHASGVCGEFIIESAVQRVDERHLERVGHRGPWGSFSATELLRAAGGVKALVIHGREDAEVPFLEAAARSLICASPRL